MQINGLNFKSEANVSIFIYIYNKLRIFRIKKESRQQKKIYNTF